jgi:hypothetical protein
MATKKRKKIGPKRNKRFSNMTLNQALSIMPPHQRKIVEEWLDPNRFRSGTPLRSEDFLGPNAKLSESVRKRNEWNEKVMSGLRNKRKTVVTDDEARDIIPPEFR